MAELKVAPFAGIDHVSGEPNEPKWLRDALNVDIDREGGVERRDGITQLLSGVTSVFGSDALGALVGVYDGNLCAVSVTPPAATSLGAVVDKDLWYAEVNGELLFSGLNTLGVVRSGAVEPLGIDVPAAPGASVSATGGLQAGTYGVCVTFVSYTGEESGASTAKFLDVDQGGGIDLNLPPSLQTSVVAVRVYATTCNGDVFYLVTETGGSTATIDASSKRGRVCDTRDKVRMRPGRYLALWKGRILTARGNVLYMSEPFRYGLCDLRTGFIQFPRMITFIAPVDGGVFVGQPSGVLFVDGADVGQAKLVDTGASSPLPGSSVVVNGEEMSLDKIDSSKKYAVWFSERGYAVGKPDGGVVEPQAKRIRIPVGQYGASVVHERRVLSLVS